MGRYTPQQEQRILELYSETGGSPSKSKEIFNDEFYSQSQVSEPTLRNRWKGAGYELNTRGGARNYEQKSRTIKIRKIDPNVKYRRANGNSENT